MDEYYRAIRLLPAWLAQPLARLPQNTAEKVHELRLRTGCGICLSIAGQQTTLDELPECPQTLRGRTLDALQMDEILYVLCGGSVHTHQAELAQGYLTTASGCRVGVGGRFVLRGPEDVVLQRLLSLNFRIARPICTELPAELCTLLQGHFIGALLVGEPDSGKTTLLRQIARELAAQKRAVAVIDERGELFPPERQNGDALDCISGLPKGRAVQMALRTLAPQVILLDELGDLTEVTALEQGFFSGVEFVASVHAATLEDALQRPQVRILQQHCGFLSCWKDAVHRAGFGRSGSFRCYDAAHSGCSAVAVVRLAGRGCHTGPYGTAPCCITEMPCASGTHPAGGRVPPGRPAAALRRALPGRHTGIRRPLLTGGPTAGGPDAGRTAVLPDVHVRPWPCGSAAGVRTAGLLPGPPAGFAANGRTRCPAAGRSAPQTGPCSRDGNGAAAHLNSEILEETTQMEIDLVFKIAAIGIIVAVLNQLLIRSGREDQAMMTTLAGLVVVLSILVKQISTLFVTIKALFSL